MKKKNERRSSGGGDYAFRRRGDLPEGRSGFRDLGVRGGLELARQVLRGEDDSDDGCGGSYGGDDLLHEALVDADLEELRRGVGGLGFGHDCTFRLDWAPIMGRVFCAKLFIIQLKTLIVLCFMIC